MLYDENNWRHSPGWLEIAFKIYPDEVQIVKSEIHKSKVDGIQEIEKLYAFQYKVIEEMETITNLDSSAVLEYKKENDDGDCEYIESKLRDNGFNYYYWLIKKSLSGKNSVIQEEEIYDFHLTMKKSQTKLFDNWTFSIVNLPKTMNGSVIPGFNNFSPEEFEKFFSEHNPNDIVQDTVLVFAFKNYNDLVLAKMVYE